MTQDELDKSIEKMAELKEKVLDRTLDKVIRQDALNQLEQDEKRIHRQSKNYSIYNIKKMLSMRKVRKLCYVSNKIYTELGLEMEFRPHRTEVQKMQENSKYLKQQVKIVMVFAVVMSLYLVIWGVNYIKGEVEEPIELTFNEFIAAVDRGDIDSLRQVGSKTYLVTYKEGMGLEGMSEKEKEAKENKRTETIYKLDDPAFEREMLEKGVKIEVEESTINIISLIGSLFSLFFYIFLIYFLYNKVFKGAMNPGQGKISKTNIEHITTKLDDVAGMDEEKEEIVAAIKSMQNTEAYRAAGIKPIKGILLEGPPGTGKTLLAKSIANEMGMPLLSYSGTEFVEMFVGVGAARIRSMYEDARKHAPCIVFIDEIDAFCKKRGRGPSSGQLNEAEGTMTELLAQMDGMIDNSGIFMMAATNMSENLDEAILRPGRFDKIIHIGIPKSKKDREAIVAVHLRDKKLTEDLTVEKIAVLCYGLSGAEIAAVMNDAALDSFRDEREGVIEKRDIESATMKLFAKGLAKGKHSKEDRHRVAIHELGHALMNEELGRKVINVSIQPYSSGVGGVTRIDGEQSQLEGLRTRQDLENDLKVLYAGKVAEELFLGECSVGASNDLARATDTLATYVGVVGMGKHNMSYNRLLEMGLKNVEGTMLEEMQTIGARVYKEVEDYLRQYKEDEEKRKQFFTLVEYLKEEGTIYSMTEVLTESKKSDKLSKEERN